MRMKRAGEIRVGNSVFTNLGVTASVHAVAIGVVDGTPCKLVDIGCLGHIGHGELTNAVPTYTGIKRNLYLSAFSPLGCHEDNTVGTTGTVKGSGCGILKHRNTGDVRRIDGRERVTRLSRDTVNDDEGGCRSVFSGCDTTDTDGHIKAGLAVDRGYLNTRSRTFQRPGYCGNILGGDVLTLNRSHGTSEIPFACSTVTNHHDFIEEESIFFEDDVEIRALTDSDFFCLVTDGRYDQGLIFSNFDGERAIQVCYNAERGALDLDTGTDHGVTL